jgi:hypothetical protein
MKIIFFIISTILLTNASQIKYQINYNREKEIQVINKQFFETDVIKNIESQGDVDEQIIYFISLKAKVLQSYKMLAPVAGNAISYIMPDGGLTMPGVAAEDIADPVEREKFSISEKHWKANRECIGKLDELGKIIDQRILERLVKVSPNKRHAYEVLLDSVK